jgi:pimeloyl-ACP methyl ester carboxylesterase
MDGELSYRHTVMRSGRGGQVEEQTRKGTPHPGRSRRVVRGLIIALLAIAVLFYGAGGWYFSTELGNDAFVVDRDDDESFDLEIVATDGASVTIRGEEGGDAGLITDGMFGLGTPQGWLHIGSIEQATTQNGFDIVTRSIESRSGGEPTPGSPADLDSWFYETDPSDLSLAFENVQFESPLGLFDAWHIPAADDTWAIVIHGKGAERREGLRVLESLNDAGLPALIITYRNDAGQPADPSGYYRYGATEWVDVEGAVRYALSRGADDVILIGLSTGAANALAFFYESDLADRTVGAIFDAPNIDFGRTVDFGASQRSLPLIGLPLPQSLTTVAKWIASLRYDFDWSQHDFIDDAELIDFPILVFHGTEDSTVPIDVSERLRDTRPDLVTLVTVEGAEHVQSWNADPPQYAATVQTFLEANSLGGASR